ncbi:MAG: sigma-54 dependent transcriptional regulator [candidate division KSB1 bacterium]|nr:sigma-54 dependent transcriptional regulator [candidate division KSB1 bacterium]MDZ7365540.1 sigma-54 dependent transcriptional regulator [candidate division KSB1 bacterium]MDZ7403643.1 sigma-54 dependent transcriptional regulator [candidate division KSB1 bacterium]
MKATLLIVDDEPGMRENFSAVLGAEYQIELAASVKEALEKLASSEIDLVLLDLHLHGRKARDRSGFEILKSIRRERAWPVGVIMFTVENDLATAVEAMQLGANDYLLKTCSDDELKAVVREVIDHARMQRAQLASEQDWEDHTSELIGESPAIVQILQEVDRLANHDGPVLIIGESGTGKELVARRLHERSWRWEQKLPYVTINCAAIPEPLAESELFGHEPGAFTGAGKKRRLGKLEIADRGTIFLDEIDSMPLALQAKLLRALDVKTFESIGGDRKIRLRARLVAAVKSDLSEAIKEKTFREDLYYRLQGAVLTLPPLRERRQDIPRLVQYFLRKLNRHYGRRIEKVTDEAMEILQRYDWPGNVRQLYQEMEQMVELAEEGTVCLTADMLSAKVRQESVGRPNQLFFEPPESMTLPEAMDLLKSQMIDAALEKAKGNITQAAKILGISRRGLQKMLKP